MLIADGCLRSDGGLQVYRIHVVTGLLCRDKRGDTASLPCYPVDADGNALTKDQFAEGVGLPAVGLSSVRHGIPEGGDVASLMSSSSSSSSSSSIAARFEEGDAWTGSYTCQGTQWFRFRILRVLARPSLTGANGPPGDVVFSATLAFRHSQANGLYRAVGRYSTMDRKLKLTAGPWIVRPADFIAIGFEGTVGFDGTTFHGVLPDCDHGPFSLSKEPRHFQPTAEAALGDIEATVEDVVKRPGVLDDAAWPPAPGDAAAGAAAAAANAVEDEVLGADGPPKQRRGGFQVMFAKSMDELDVMEAQLRAGGGRRCPEKFPYAYRPDRGFDYCCASEDDNDGNLGVNAGPMEFRADNCKSHDFTECPMPPCADYAAGLSDIDDGGDLVRGGDAVGEDEQIMKAAKEQIKVRSPPPHTHTTTHTTTHTALPPISPFIPSFYTHTHTHCPPSIPPSPSLTSSPSHSPTGTPTFTCTVFFCFFIARRSVRPLGWPKRLPTVHPSPHLRSCLPEAARHRH